MLEKILKQENDFATKIISEYETAIKETETAIAGIEEKYRKMAEEESKTLSAELEQLQSRLNSWKATLPVQAEKEEEEEKIVDTIFPENNESPCNDSDEPAEEPQEIQEENPGEPAVADPVELEAQPETAENWEDETKSNEDEGGFDDGFPDTPEEW